MTWLFGRALVEQREHGIDVEFLRRGALRLAGAAVPDAAGAGGDLLSFRRGFWHRRLVGLGGATSASGGGGGGVASGWGGCGSGGGSTFGGPRRTGATLVTSATVTRSTGMAGGDVLRQVEASCGQATLAAAITATCSKPDATMLRFNMP